MMRSGNLFSLPNLLTYSRILMIPLLVFVFYLPWKASGLAAAGIFILAAITDWFDGFLARKLNQDSKLGQFLDPVADKLIVVVTLVILVEYQGVWYFTVPACLIIAREIAISALREWMAQGAYRGLVAVSALGKWKTTLQMVAMIVFLARLPSWGEAYETLSYCILYLATVLTFLSMINYLKAAWIELKK
ncbi:MAG: CDP-diacylglycerol--glycerol-3-phosphate 3-phosphatidyltransferase [Pseudomonadota bacterium]